MCVCLFGHGTEVSVICCPQRKAWPSLTRLSHILQNLTTQRTATQTEQCSAHGHHDLSAHSSLAEY